MKKYSLRALVSWRDNQETRINFSINNEALENGSYFPAISKNFPSSEKPRHAPNKRDVKGDASDENARKIDMHA